MRKITSSLFMLFFIFLLMPMVLAERYEDNFFKSIEITNQGGLVNEQSIDDVNVIGFVCSSSNCATVSATLWGGAILNSGTDIPSNFLQLVYPTTLQSPYGYGIYMYKEGYIPYEVAADYWGTSNHDPVGPYDNYLAKKQLCRSDILYFDVDHNPLTDEVEVEFEIASPITHAGLLDYVPPEILSHYSANAKVNLEVLKDGQPFYTDDEVYNLEYSASTTDTFTFNLNGVGEYSIRIYTTLETEDKCLDYLEDEDSEIIIIEEPPECTEDSDCGTDYYSDEYCVGDDLYEDFHDFFCDVGECGEDIIPILVEECEYGCADDECLDEPVCFVNSDCGIDQCYGEDNYCLDNDVYQDFIFFVCNNPGQPNAFCSNFLGPVLLEDCGDSYCENWSNFCQNGDLYHSRTCYDKGCAIGQCFSASLPEEELVEDCLYGCDNGECLPEPLECTQDSDCPDDYYSDPYCSLDELYEDFHDFSCETDTCIENISQVLIETCAYGCDNGECLPEPLECTQDSDCPDDYYSDTYCSNDDVMKDFHDFSCEENVCVENTSQILVEECDDECEDGECEEDNDNGGGRRGGGYYAETEDSQVLGDVTGTVDYSFLTNSISETQHLGRAGAVQTRTTGFSIPLWLIILLIVLIVVFLILIIIASLAR